MKTIQNGFEYQDGYYIPANKIGVIEGNLLTTVELLGLPKEQSEALKSQVRQIIWGRGFMRYGIDVTSTEIASLRNHIKGEPLK